MPTAQTLAQSKSLETEQIAKSGDGLCRATVSSHLVSLQGKEKDDLDGHCTERAEPGDVMKNSRSQSHDIPGSQPMENPNRKLPKPAVAHTPPVSSTHAGVHLDGSIKTYDNFYQELEKDFGQLPQFPSPQGSDNGRKRRRDNRGQSHAPYTSTLEHKHDNNSQSDRHAEFFAKNYDSSQHDRQSKKVLNDHKPQGRTSFSSQSNCSSLRSDSHYSGSYHSPAGRHQSFNSKSHNPSSNHQMMSSPQQLLGMKNENSSHINSFQTKGNHLNVQDSPQSTFVHQEHPDNSPSSAMHVGNSYNENCKNTTSLGMSPLGNNRLSSHGQLHRNQNSRANTGKNVKSTHTAGTGYSTQSSHKFENVTDNTHISSNSDSEQADRTLRPDGTSKWVGKSDSDDMQNVPRWPESNYSYSDNEKQLLEEMRRMKKEHQNVLRTYEGRINKLMAKMHELRNIAEMLENSSTKSSPFGVLPGKLALLNILGDSGENEMKKGSKANESHLQLGGHIPPPLPPRPAKGSRVYPNKPIIHTNTAMRNLPWDRIILDGPSPDVMWKDMAETDVDKEELERLFSGVEDMTPVVNLYEDICQRRGNIQMQSVHFYEAEHSQRIRSELCNLKCNLQDVTKAFVTLNPGDLHIDSFAELLELLTAHREIDKIIHHGKRKGTSQLDVPEFLVFELSRIDHFKERLEFLRFKNKLQINLFEIDQQLKELHIACDEISSSLPLKHVLGTILAVGNYMNGGTDMGQADGYKIEILTSLKYLQDKSKRGNLLELVMKIYCQKFESDRDFGCPTHFHLPEPSNMRHAAQVSFEDIQRALKELKDELSFVMNKLENLSKWQTTITMSLRVTSENFFTSAVEVLAEEQKLLEDTKIHFAKTTAFFSHNEHPTSPKEFFQLWASFLHDCKYYWKLAHRNLARAKFTEDLAMKNQMSSSSLPGFNNLKSVMMKHVVSFQQEDEMDESKAQQLQHISSWIESIGRYAMEIQPESFIQPQDSASISSRQHPQHQQQQTNHYHHPKQPQHVSNSHNQNQHYESPQNQSNRHNPPRQQQHSPPYVNSAMYQSERHKLRNQPDVVPSDHSTNPKEKPNNHFDSQDHPPRPSSPKPLSAIPPNVIRPQPITHTSPTISSPSPSSPNIHNQINPLSFYSSQSKEIPEDEADENFGFSSPQLNLKPDLTPEVLIPDKSMEFQSPISPTGTSHSKKNQNFFKALLKKDQKKSPHLIQESGGNVPTSKTVVTPFNKIKNTFVHKLSAVGNSKKSDGKTENNTGQMTSPIQENTQMQDLNSFLLENEVSQGQMSSKSRREESEKNINMADYQNFHPQPVEDEMLQSDRSDVMNERGGSVASSASTIHRYQDQVISSYGFNSDMHKSVEQLNDMPDKNYNTSSAHEKVSPNTRSSKSLGSTRLRAPIALGSNMSISDIFGSTGDKDKEPFEKTMEPQSRSQIHVSPFRAPKVATVPSSSDPKLVRAEAVPVYKAKLIPNYENQTKLDPRIDFGIRGQAEAVRVPHPAMTNETYKMQLQKQSEKYVSGGSYSGYGQHSRSGTIGNVPGAPTTYTVMPPKSNHHQSPSVQVPSFASQHQDHNTPSRSSHHQSNHGSKSNEKEQRFERRDYNHNIENKDDYTSTPGQEHRQNNEIPNNFQAGSDGNTPLGASSKADSSRTQGRRSTSAHNLLSGNLRHPDQQQAQYQPTKGHISRRDATEIKVTPTSRRALSQGRSKPTSETVTSLIDKFERKPLGEPNPMGLLDVNEKPPSMTSTPVTRRKTFCAKTSPYDFNGNVSPSNSDAGSQRSRPIQGEQRKDGLANDITKNLNDHFASFGSPSQTVTPFNASNQQKNDHVAGQMSSEFQEDQFFGNQLSKQNASSLDRGRQRQDLPQDFQESPLSQQENTSGPQQSFSPASFRTPSDLMRSNQGRSSSSQRSVHSSADSSSHKHRHSNPSVPQSSNFQSPYLPKPEPHYPSSTPNYSQSVASSQQNLSVAAPVKSSPVTVHSKNQLHQHSRPGGSSHSSLSPQAYADQSQHHQNIPHQHLQQDTVPLGYHSWPSSLSASISQQHQSRRDIDIVQMDAGNYTQQLRKAYQSNTSAFERPLKSSHHQSGVGQKSNTAIVKPTVMHL